MFIAVLFSILKTILQVTFQFRYSAEQTKQLYFIIFDPKQLGLYI